MARGQRKILVTGSTSGIGLEVAKQLLNHGFYVILHGTGLNIDVYEEIKKQYPESCDAWWFNLTEDPEASLSDYLDRSKHRLWGLVNNAGIIPDNNFWECNYENLGKLFEINTFSSYVLSKVFMKQVDEIEGGRIVNISSVAVHFGMGRNQSVQYAGTKASLEALTSGLARIGASKNILVNAVRPGCILTRIQKNRSDFQERVDLIPVKRMGTEAEVASLVNYFFSENASFITNQVVTVSGGE